MGLKEIFDKALYDQYLISQATITPKLMAITLGVVALLVAFVLVIYRVTYRGAVFSPSFAISMIISAMATSLIILPISSNIALSIGTGGVLSMVRYRTAVKDPKDIAFMFWAIALGLICGIGYYAVAAVGTAVIGIVMVLMHFLTEIKSFNSSCVAVIRVKPDTNIDKVVGILGKTVTRSIVTTQDYIELTIEVDKMPAQSVLNALNKSEKIINSSFVKYNGDYAL